MSIGPACPCSPFLELCSIAPMDQPQESKRMLQGGGVYVRMGNVNFNNCQIYNNEADWVSARFSAAIPWPPCVNDDYYNFKRRPLQLLSTPSTLPSSTTLMDFNYGTSNLDLILDSPHGSAQLNGS